LLQNGDWRKDTKLLERYISLPETTVIIVGTKQKELGKKIARRSQRVKIYGKYYPVEARFVK
jgi:metallo-beta-lactamase family protein